MSSEYVCSACSVRTGTGGRCPNCKTYWLIIDGKLVGFPPFGLSIDTVAKNLAMALANARGGYVDSALVDAVLAQAEAAGLTWASVDEMDSA